VLMNNYLEDLKNEKEIRRMLIAVKEAVRDDKERKTLARLLAGDFSVFADLLKNEDPKVRKNAALLLGIMEAEPYRDVLWEAYQREETLFIKADYIKALAHFDCSMYVEQIKKRMEDLGSAENGGENEKHTVQELSALKTLLIKTERPKKHMFTGKNSRMEVILMTNRSQRQVTAEQLPEKNLRLLAGGIRFETTHLEEILPIRTYSEILFPIPGIKHVNGSPEHMAELLTGPALMEFLEQHHTGGWPFYFRLDIKTAMPQERRVDLLKKLSLAIERASERKLLNAPSGYEVELRLVANKEGGFVPLLKLFTFHDWRFAYRRELLPTSIAPVNAAIIMQIAKEYFVEGAQVLDPFCGTGTMLIERRMLGRTGSMYGLDILEEAVLKARINTESARVRVNYINRDFFDFRHEYRFDEIITNLPGCSKQHSEEKITELYQRFLDKIPELMKQEALLVLHTNELKLLTACTRNRREFRKLREEVLNEREGSGVLLLRYVGGNKNCK
jgi:SAM-dependent methyltransferase